MQNLNLSLRPDLKSSLPVRVLQFGEGNFMRGFIDWMVCKLNQHNLFNGRIVALQPSPYGNIEKLKPLLAQDCLYTTILHGVKGDREIEDIEVMNVIADAKNAHAQWPEVLALASLVTLKFIFSNTTEAGIVYENCPNSQTEAPKSFPAKLTSFLYERFKHFNGSKDSGLVIVPCELIEDNGAKLKQIVLKHAADWNLGSEFTAYVNDACRFLNTLVDRIVSGYPREHFAEYEQRLGYHDAMLDCAETFGFMAIEGDKEVEELLPFNKIGLNVVVASDITPYRLRKVRILNGTHTSNVPAAFLAGLETVDQMMTDAVTGPFARSVVYDEIIPAVNLDKGMLTEFADAVMDRFSDPALNHHLSAILMNSTSKLKARVLPTVFDARAKGQLPHKLAFAIAAYLALYQHADASSNIVKVQRAEGKSGQFQDDAYAVAALAKAWSFYKKSEATALMVVKSALSDVKLWDRDISSDLDLTALVAKYLHAIISDGVKATMQAIAEKN